jgi:glycogen(starch) synthase
VFITADTIGGVWTYALDLAQGLCNHGDTVLLVVLGPSPTAAQYSEAVDAGVLVLDTGLPLDWISNDVIEFRRGASRLVETAQAWRADVVHLSTPALAGVAHFPMPVVGVAHSCLATWWAAVRTGPPPSDFAWRIEAVAQGYAACNALIAPSVAFAAATAKIYGVSPVPIYNGRSQTAGESHVVRDIPIVTAGRLWDEGKDAATLDLAAGMMDVPVLALGSVQGPQQQEITFDWMHSLGVMPAVDVAKTFARAQIFVSTARYEPFGLSVLEAAQAGCALVLSDIATFRELWDGAAIFVPPGDAGGLARAIAKLRNRPDELERLSVQSRVHAKRYSVIGCIEATRALHSACLQSINVEGALT